MTSWRVSVGPPGYRPSKSLYSAAWWTAAHSCIAVRCACSLIDGHSAISLSVKSKVFLALRDQGFIEPSAGADWRVSQRGRDALQADVIERNPL